MPRGAEHPADEPSAEAGASLEAVSTLRELHAIGRRSRHAASTNLTGIPLASWGTAWSAGFAVLDLASWRIAVPLALLLAVGAAVGTWAVRSPEVRSGWERRIQVGWVALFLSSPFLVASVSPVAVRVELVFLGALWGVALLLYAVATTDFLLGAVGGITVLAAAFCRPLVPEHPLLTFGVVAGGAMLLVGSWRIRLSR